MRRLVLLSLLLGMSVSVALAQDYPKGELFGGFAYLRSQGANFNGWNASITENANNWVGVKADFSGSYNTKVTEGIKGELWLHNFLFGPQFSLRKTDPVTPFFHTLIGVTHRNLKVSDPVMSESGSKVAFAVGIGGGIDVKITQGLAFRAFQADYIFNRTQGDTINNVRLSVGFVYRFASK